jgi:hypothetical protein
VSCGRSPAVADFHPAAFTVGGERAHAFGDDDGGGELDGSKCRPMLSGRGVLKAEKRKGQSLALAPASSSPVGSSERLARHLRALAVNRCRDGSESSGPRQAESGQGRGAEQSRLPRPFSNRLLERQLKKGRLDLGEPGNRGYLPHETSMNSLED